MSWFPIAQDLIENPLFKALSPTTKIYYLWCISEFNRRGPFYRSDLEVAVTLRAAVVTIRKARRALTALGWLTIRPGTRAHGRSLATWYYNVKWSTTKECTWFAQQQRLAFETIITELRLRRFQHGDVWLYLCLSYLQWRFRGRGDSNVFSVSKRVLTEMSGLHDIGERLQWLYERFSFITGEPLFRFRGYQQLEITNWQLPAVSVENGDDEYAAGTDAWMDFIKEQARLMRENNLSSPQQFYAWHEQQFDAGVLIIIPTGAEQFEEL